MTDLGQFHCRGDRLLKLRAKLKAREGIPGYEKNCKAIEAEIKRLEKSSLTTQPEQSQEPSAPAVASKRKPVKRHRSAITGEFVTPAEAAANPGTTVSETDK